MSAVGDFEDLFIGVGNLVANRTKWIATGRVVALNASVDAVIIDEAIAGSPPDRYVVQPVVRNRERFEGILSVVETPLIMAMIESNPTDENIARLTPALTRAVRRSLPIMVPAIKKVREREQKLKEAAVEVYAELGLPPGTDPVAAIVQDFLAPLYIVREGAMATEPGEPIDVEVVA